VVGVVVEDQRAGAHAEQVPTVGTEGTDVDVIELYSESLGDEGSPADTYVGMIQTNAERIAAALR
jgi:ABC-type Zn uptake system ZnuABC Zn-binding protein ZnuA